MKNALSIYSLDVYEHNDQISRQAKCNNLCEDVFAMIHNIPGFQKVIK